MRHAKKHCTVEEIITVFGEIALEGMLGCERSAVSLRRRTGRTSTGSSHNNETRRNEANEGIRTKISMSGFVTYERRTLEFEEM